MHSSDRARGGGAVQRAFAGLFGCSALLCALGCSALLCALGCSATAPSREPARTPTAPPSTPEGKDAGYAVTGQGAPAGDCSARVEQPPLPTDPPRPAQSQCRIASLAAPLRDVHIQLSPDQRIRLDLMQVQGVLVLHAGSEPWAEVLVDAPLRLRGWALPSALGLAHPVELASGLLTAGTAARLGELTVQGDHVEARVALGDAALRSRLPCSALALPPERGATPLRERANAGQWVRGAGGQFVLYPQPRAHGQSAILNGELALRVSERRGDWVHLDSAFEDGTRIAGWTPASATQSAGDAPPASGYGEGLSLCRPGCAGLGAGASRRRVRIAAATPVHASPGGPVWAELSVELETVALAAASAAAWVQLLVIPGVEEDPGCHSMEHAYVEHGSVQWLDQ